MKKPTQQDDEHPSGSHTKKAWEEPSIETLGRISEVVQGGGKVGSNVDMDPQATFKAGGG